MHKFGRLDSTGHDIAFRYPDLWECETTTRPERIVAAPATNHPLFDSEEARLLSHWEWQHFPLMEGQDKMEGEEER